MKTQSKIKQPAKKKGLTFGTIVGIFGGGMLIVIILSVVAIKMSGSGQKTTVSKKITQQPVLSVPQNIVNKDEFEEMQSTIKSQSSKLERSLQTQNLALASKMDEIINRNNQLEQRVSKLESTKSIPSQVRIIKEKSKSQPIEDGGRDKKYRSVVISDYEVTATIGNRAFIKNGNKEDSVTKGDIIKKNDKVNVVNHVDNKRGVVVTTLMKE